MKDTFMIVSITPHVRDSSWDKPMLFHSKKAFLLHSVLPVTEYTWATHLEEELTYQFFLKAAAYSLSHTGRVNRNGKILLMVNIKLIRKR